MGTMTMCKRSFLRMRLNGAFALVFLALIGAQPPICSAQSLQQTEPGDALFSSPPNDGPPPQPGQLATPAGPSAEKTSGILGNTMSAPPFTVGEKFNYRVLQSFSVRGFLGGALAAGIGQATGTPYAWGGGAEGFGKRYGSALLGSFARQSFAFTIDSALHDDPRYFPSLEKGFKPRTFNAIKQVFICKTDAGHASFAYGRVVSAFASGQLVNAWQPGSNGSVGDGFQRGLYAMSADLALNLAQEFITSFRHKTLRNPRL